MRVGLGASVSYALTKGQMTRAMAMASAKVGLIPARSRLHLGLVDRPHYAFGVLNAAREAKALGFKAVTVMEFGVAGGNGLIALERHAQAVESESGIRIDVVGFDSGAGLTPPSDYRDAPFLWAQGDFAMDEAGLRARLTRAQLVLGDVRTTVKEFMTSIDQSAPVGFAAFDLDLWSSTLGAFDVFRGDPAGCLPRVWCYFDDIVAMIDDIGVPLAISDFNSEGDSRRIRHPWMLRNNVPFQAPWADQMFQAHLFDHPGYVRMVAAPSDRALPLNP